MSTEKSRMSTSICTRINTISRQLTRMTFRRYARAGRLRGASKFAIRVNRPSFFLLAGIFPISARRTFLGPGLQSYKVRAL